MPTFSAAGSPLFIKVTPRVPSLTSNQLKKLGMPDGATPLPRVKYSVGSWMTPNWVSRKQTFLSIPVSNFTLKRMLGYLLSTLVINSRRGMSA